MHRVLINLTLVKIPDNTVAMPDKNEKRPLLYTVHYRKKIIQIDLSLFYNYCTNFYNSTAL